MKRMAKIKNTSRGEIACCIDTILQKRLSITSPGIHRIKTKNIVQKHHFRTHCIDFFKVTHSKYILSYSILHELLFNKYFSLIYSHLQNRFSFYI